MDVRTRTEEIERLTLAPWATFSDESRGRQRPEEQDPIRPVFQRDRDRVLHCKAFRRLKQKTQVFLSPEGDLYRTRLTHTLEVSQIARTIARALRLNEDLTEAISLAHDLGHTPFGHAGERALDKLTPGGFKHYMQSLRVVDKLEKDGQGLNLTWEVRNGIVTHTKGTWAATPEGRIVRMADQIAYVNHDIEDAVRAGVLDPATLPKDCTAVLGQTKSARITTMINSILAHSDGDVEVGAEENESLPRPAGLHVCHRVCGQDRQGRGAEGGQGHRGAVRVLSGPCGPDVQLLRPAGLSGRPRAGRHRLYQRHERRICHPDL